jgi:hypothetical protein
MLDTHTDHAFEDGDGMLGDKLLEGDEEAGLDCYSAGDRGCSGKY